MKKKKTAKTPEAPTSKICNRCKVEKIIRQNFTIKMMERVSGTKQWIHPWCFECRNTVKEKWGTNWIGGKDGNKNVTTIRKKKIKTKLSSVSRRNTTKTMRRKRITRTIPKRNSKRRDNIMVDNRRKIGVSCNSKSGPIIKTLRKNKDYVGE